LTASDDKVGIGTSDPAATLDIQGTLNVGIDDIGYDVNFYGRDAGSRLFWDESKMAFRAGIAAGTEWDNANVGPNSVAMGYSTKANGNYSTAVNYNTTASGWASMAMNGYTTASGTYSTAMGSETIASGLTSIAIGARTSAEAYLSTAIGRYNVGGGTANDWIATEPLFEIGIGDIVEGIKSNALTVLKNGNMGILKAVPAKPLDVNGDIRFIHTNCVQADNPTSGNTSDGEGGIYFRNTYFVVWYNYHGDMKYLKVDVNAGQTTFTTGAPD